MRFGGTLGWQHVSFGGVTDSFQSAGADVTLDTRVDPLLPRNAVFASASWEHLVFASGAAIEPHAPGRPRVSGPDRTERARAAGGARGCRSPAAAVPDIPPRRLVQPARLQGRILRRRHARHRIRGTADAARIPRSTWPSSVSACSPIRAPPTRTESAIAIRRSIRLGGQRLDQRGRVSDQPRGRPWIERRDTREFWRGDEVLAGSTPSSTQTPAYCPASGRYNKHHGPIKPSPSARWSHPPCLS